MKLYCLHIPRKVTTEADAIYETTWNITNPQLFQHLLDELNESIRDPFSLELYSKDNTIYVCFGADESIADVIVAGLYALLPDAQLSEIEDYTQMVNEEAVVAGGEMRLGRSDVLPLQDFRKFSYDSLAPIFPILANLGSDDRALIQIVCQPLPDNALLSFSMWRKRLVEKASQFFKPRLWLKRDLALKTIEQMVNKCNQKLYAVNYRIAAWTEGAVERDRHRATRIRLEQHLRNIANAVRVVNTIDENQLVLSRVEFGLRPYRKFQARYLGRPFRLSTSELTTIFHPPSLGTLPNTVQVLSKRLASPRTLPLSAEDPQISLFGQTNYRDHIDSFGIRRFDRRRHFYVLGKSGSGKSCMLQLLVKNDIDHGFGCAVLDPHGDLVDDILKMIPKHRLKDVVLFDPSDVKYPPSFNPLHAVRPELKMRVTIGFLDVFQKVFKADWSDRMDHLLRYALMVLLDVPGASFLSLRRFLTDDAYRTVLVKNCRDQSVRRFWESEFANRRDEYEDGVISRVVNRLDELLATDMLRNILGQPQNLYNFREFMDTRKIVLMKVSKGILGAENVALLGSLIIAKIYEAAMSRADMPAEDRQDFYFYIDEFQTFATESFGEILSESRKYKLCLTFANQFLGQLSGSIRQTVFGNVGNLLAFRVGGDDAATLAQEFKPRVSQEDIINLGLRDFYLKMCIDGEVQEPFSGHTLDLDYPPVEEQLVKDAIEQSRQRYSLHYDDVKETIAVTERARYDEENTPPAKDHEERQPPAKAANEA